MIIEELKKEYATQDNRGTAYPFYVQVQELRFVGVIADGYSVSCPFGDGETKEEFKHPDYEGAYDSEQELLDQMLEENGQEYANNECSNIEVGGFGVPFGIASAITYSPLIVSGSLPLPVPFEL